MLLIEIIFWMCAALIAYHMFGHPALLLLVSRRAERYIRKDKKGSNKDWQPVDIVMPMYNEADCIKQKLENLSKLDYPKHLINIYLGLDGCDDSTRCLIEEVLRNDKFRSLKTIIIDFPVNRGKIKVLNDLMRIGQSECVFLTDVSALLPSNTIKQLSELLHQNKVGAVSAGYQLMSAGQEGETAYWQYQSRIKRAESYLGSVIGAHGACYAIRRSLFSSLPNNIINDDFIVPMNIISQGYRVVYEADIVAMELEGSTSQQDFERRKRISLGNVQQLFACANILSFRYRWTAYNFLFGKVVRATIPSLLAVILICSVLLSAKPFYLFLLTFQIAIYGATLIGIALKKSPNNIYLYLIYYVVSGYIAGLIGTVQFLLGKANYSWQKK